MSKLPSIINHFSEMILTIPFNNLLIVCLLPIQITLKGLYKCLSILRNQQKVYTRVQVVKKSSIQIWKLLCGLERNKRQTPRPRDAQGHVAATCSQKIPNSAEDRRNLPKAWLRENCLYRIAMIFVNALCKESGCSDIVC